MQYEIAMIKFLAINLFTYLFLDNKGQQKNDYWGP